MEDARTRGAPIWQRCAGRCVLWGADFLGGLALSVVGWTVFAPTRPSVEALGEGGEGAGASSTHAMPLFAVAPLSQGGLAVIVGSSF